MASFLAPTNGSYRLDGGELIYANAQAESLFRHQLSGVDARRVQDFYMNPADREAVTAMLRGEGVVRDNEVRLRTRDGDGFWALISCSVIHSDGELLVISGVNDISEREYQIERGGTWDRSWW